MAKNKVHTFGTRSEMLPDGSYRLVYFYRLEDGRFHEEQIDGLAWTELCDCLLTVLDEHRPGWEVGSGWRQPDLFSSLD